MTRIKYIVFFLLGALYSSSWWALALFKEPALIVPVIVSTVLLVVFSSVYVGVHWNDNS